MITYEVLKEPSEKHFADILALLPQLRSNPSSDYKQPEYSDLVSLLADHTAALVVVKDEDRIIGMATLFILARVGEIAGYVEDVVVDSGYRGQGLATKLMEKLIEVAREHKVKVLDLTSRPAREAANHLYQKLGFVKRETNPYRLKL